MVKEVMMDNFLHFCQTLQSIGETRSTAQKVELFAGYLESVSHSESAVALACQFAGEGAFGQTSGKRVGVGSRTLALSASAFCEIDHDLVFRPCRTATGSGSEAIALLLSNLPAIAAKQMPRTWSLTEVYERLETLSVAKKREEKEAVLEQIWREFTPLEVKFLLRIMGQGSLRIGFETRSILRALAHFTEQEMDQIRYAHMVSGSLYETARLAINKTLDEVRFQLFRPISFMLASPLSEDLTDSFEFSAYAAEEKFDGIRCQIHVEKETVSLFSRDLNEITESFPDLVEEFRQRTLPATVLDGEIVAYKEHRILPFQRLQKRLGVKKPSAKLVREIPVHFIGYDLLYHDQQEVLNQPLLERRKHLENVASKHGLSYSRQFSVQNASELRDLFQAARERGNEGIMLKKKESVYEFGQRKNSWLKVKEPAGSLDTVILYAQAGSGKRGGTYSDFTLGISVREDDRYEEEFVPIGKAYGGYTDQELREINRRIRSLIVERFGPTLALRPEIVVELEFDAIQVNKRTKAGYSLRFPRFKAIRWDLSVKDVDTLQDVEALLKAQESRVTESQVNPVSFILPQTE